MGQMLDPSGGATPAATPGSSAANAANAQLTISPRCSAIRRSRRSCSNACRSASPRAREKSGQASSGRHPNRSQLEELEPGSGGRQAADHGNDFVPGPQRIVPETMAMRMAHGSGQRQAELVALFNKVLDSIEPQTRSNNVAAALAFAIAASEQVKDGSGVLKPGRYADLVRQINQDVGDSEEFKARSDRRKQEIYESSLLTAGLIVSAFRRASASKDPTLERQAKEAAADYLRQMNGVQP
jgi:hypothetical protein